MQKKSPVLQRLVALVGSPQFFWGVVALLVLQAAWIALSGRYPMAFDEDFHLGIIRLYAHHISPFWNGQPAGADVYGAVARDPSYLYHFLMSFPYRFISLFTHDQTLQVLWLRALNIGLLASALPIFRRLLLKTGASRAVVHGCLLLFVLIPVVPLLAAQINYDNLLIPVVGLILLLVSRFSDGLKADKPINLPLLLGILMVCLLASLVKYAFLPVFVAIVGYLLVRWWQTFGTVRQFWLKLAAGARLVSRRTWLLLAVGLVMAGGLFGERYGVNLVRYHTPVPDCSQALSVKQCSAYGPWIRDYNFKINRVDEEHNPLVFTADWLYGMWLRLFFAIGGPGSDYQSRGPLPVPAISAIVFAGLGAGLLLRYGRQLFRRYNARLLSLLTVTTSAYIVVLWLDEYQAYVHTGQPVAISGRYLLPVLLPLLLMVALAFGELLQHRRRLKLLVAGLAVLTLLWGGGALTYILRSNDAWYWPAQPVYDVNHAVQHILGPITPGSNDPTEFLR